MDEVSAARRRHCSGRVPPTGSTTTSTRTSTSTSRRPAGSATSRGYDRPTMLELCRRARRRPRTARQARPARPAAVADGQARASRPGTSPVGPGRPGWHIECAVIAGNRLGAHHRRAGRRLGPDLPAPRVLGRPRRGAARGRTGSPGTTRTPAWSGWTARRCPSPAGTWCSCPGCWPTGVDPMAIRAALLADHYRTDRPWTAASPAARQRSGWRPGERPRSAPAPTPPPSSRRSAQPWRTTWTRPPPMRCWTRWAADEALEGAPVAAAVDALLGIALD